MATMVTPEAPVKAQGYQRQTAGQPAEQGLGQSHQALRRLALAQEITGEGEEGDRQQHRSLRQAVELDGDDGEVHVGLVKAEEGAGGDDGEEGRAEQGQTQQEEGGQHQEDNSGAAGGGG